MDSKPTNDTHERRNSAWVEISLLMTVFFFGTNFVAVKYVVDFMPPILFAAARFTFAGLFLWTILRIFEPGSRMMKGDFLRLLGLGIVGITVTQSVFTIGVSLTTAANTAVVYATAPVWGMLLGFFLKLERPRLTGIVGIVMCLFGVGIVQYGSLDIGGSSVLGDFLILVAAVCWGSYTVLSLPFLERYSPLAVAAYPILLGGLAAFPLSLVDWNVSPDVFGGWVVFAVLYSTFLSSAFGFVGWQRGVSKVGANRVLVYQYLVMLTGVSAGIVLLGESFGVGQMIGAVVILLGVYLARRK